MTGGNCYGSGRWNSISEVGLSATSLPALGATERFVSRWLSAARRGVREALTSHIDRRSVVPRLAPERFHLMPDFLWHGSESYGFRGDIWTCGRIAGVIREDFNVSYSESQVSRLLERLDWTPQVPITRRIPRDEEAIAWWRPESWPSLGSTDIQAYWTTTRAASQMKPAKFAAFFS
ncbi:MAG: winged helix-turn-helix domain-containing protein [Isosphaeraceae bacterium]